MNVVFVEPSFPGTQRNFVRALAESGAYVIGIGDRPADWLGDELRGWLGEYHQVSDVTDAGVLTDAVRWVQSRQWVDRLETTIEAHTLPVAHAREACDIPGTSIRTAWLCRDKPSMKQALREAGVPTAASAAADTAEDVYAFADAVGFPLILKPRTGAGALDTIRVDTRDELAGALDSMGAADSIAVEEFVEGHEGFYDTLSVDGDPQLDFVSHYFPNVLEAMRTRWISPQFIATIRVDNEADYRQLRELGRQVNAALGIGTTATHMEWFFGPKGLRFSEIGCRPPGVGAWDLYSAGNDLDLYRAWAWADAIVHGSVGAHASRSHAAGIVALRPDRDGTITGYEGIDEAQAQLGEWVMDAHLPPPGTPTQPVEAGYMANAYVRMRHPDYDVLRRMLDDVGRSVHVHAE